MFLGESNPLIMILNILTVLYLVSFIMVIFGRIFAPHDFTQRNSKLRFFLVPIGVLMITAMEIVNAVDCLIRNRSLFDQPIWGGIEDSEEEGD